MPTIDENTGTADSPLAEIAAAGFTDDVVVTNDTLTPAGQAPTVYIDANAELLGTVNITSQNGAEVFVTEPVDVLGVVNLYADGGTINLGSSTVGALGDTTAVIENGGTLVGSGGTLVGLLNGGGISFGSGGGTLDIVGGESLLNLSGAAPLNGFTAGDTVIAGDVNYADIASYSVEDDSGNQVLTFYNGSSTSLGSLTFSGDTFSDTGIFAANAGPLQLSQDASGYVEVMTCFLAGTRIATRYGDVPVELVRPGDMVETIVDHEIILQPVIWVGRRTVAVSSNTNDDSFPVRIGAGAISVQCPRRDLLVTSDHCIFIDGVLVPARMLVNGGSINIARDIKIFTYFHIELQNHSILRSEGLASESYLDTGNRAGFKASASNNADANPLVKPQRKDWAKDAAAPLAVDPARVEPIWRRLRDRACALGLLVMQDVVAQDRKIDLHLLTDGGVKIRPYQIDGEIYGFALPAGISGARLMSKTVRPCDQLGPFVDDRRELGVLVGEMNLVSRSGTVLVEAHLRQNDLAGWHAIEAGGRWTAGNADLPLSLVSLADAPGLLKIQLLSLGPVVTEAQAFGATGNQRAA